MKDVDSDMLKFYLIISFYILLALLGGFIFVFGGYDDSPGAQGLGVLVVIGGVVGIIKIKKK